MMIDPERSSLTLVRPFLFAPEEADRVLEQVREARGAGRGDALTVWEPVALATLDWLPHIAESLVATPTRPAIAAWFRLTSAFLQSEYGLAATPGFEFVPKKDGAAPVPLHLELLQLVLFRNGVGFVVQRWKLATTSWAEWLDVQHYGHFANLERGGTLRLRAKDGGVRLFPNPYAHETRTPHEGDFAALDTIALASAELGAGRRVPIRDVFIKGRTLPYAVIFATGPDDPAWPRDKCLYKLRHLFHADQTYHPTAEQLALAPPNVDSYLRDQWFYHTLEGGGFVAFDAPDTGFFRDALPSHLETEYFLLFQLALQQRFTLMDLSADVARHWRSRRRTQSRDELRQIFERIRDQLFDFTARYQFVQLAQRANLHSVYQRWREVFQIRDLYDEVCLEVREMNEYLQDRDKHAREARFARVTLFLTILFGAPSLAIGFWNINIKEYTSTDGFTLREAMQAVLGVAGGIAGLLTLVLRWGRRK